MTVNVLKGRGVLGDEPAHRTPRLGVATTSPLLMLQDKRIRFVLTGALNTGFGFACFVVMQSVVGVRFGYMWALILTHVVSVMFAFASHRRLVFRVTGSLWRDIWRFESVYLFGLGLNALLLPFAVEVLALPVLVAQAAITALNAVVSWLGHSRFTFRRSVVVR